MPGSIMWIRNFFLMHKDFFSFSTSTITFTSGLTSNNLLESLSDLLQGSQTLWCTFLVCTKLLVTTVSGNTYTLTISCLSFLIVIWSLVWTYNSNHHHEHMSNQQAYKELHDPLFFHLYQSWWCQPHLMFMLPAEFGNFFIKMLIPCFQLSINFDECLII